MRVSHSARSLDVLNAMIAAMQTAFGAFVPVYLAGNAWTQAQIGVALTLETIAAMLFQVPGGALVDAVHRSRLLLAAAILGIALTALALAAIPTRLPVMAALVLHALAGCLLTPAIAAVTLVLVGRRDLGERLGRNVRFASIGSGLGAAVMGGLASLISERAVFVLAALLAIPALAALATLHPRRRTRVVILTTSDGGGPPAEPQTGTLRDLLRDRRLRVFCAAVVLFHFSSAALLTVAAVEVTRRAGMRAGLLIAAFIIIPQILVALASPLVGRLAERIGRRPVLLVGFASLPVRAGLFALLGNPFLLVPVQLLEGVAAATYGVLLPLIAADLTRTTGRYTFTLGVLGLAGTLGAALSTSVAGFVASRWGVSAAFWMMTAFGGLAFALVLHAMPETRLRQKSSAPPGHS